MRTTASDVRLLDNPIWNALSTEQAYLAQGNRLAKRFPKDVAPFAAMANQSVAEYQALAEIMHGDAAALALGSPPAVPPGWSTLFRGRMYQMVFEGVLPVSSNRSYRRLAEADVPEMLALTRLTEPGPFLPHTIDLGAYFGIHESGKLVAMAGERLHLTGFTEVSAVCTHPDFRGRGYGHALMSVVIAGILSRGETPFLHVKTDNPAAHLYQKLGFRQRFELHLAVIRKNNQN
jgi:ribosomal protein S18 acetylase RimI-like enzyme